MTIFRGSRYRLESPIQSIAADGSVESHPPLRRTTIETEPDFKRYKTQAGDTMESLAFSKYGDGNKWYIIADANPQVFWPLDLEVGVAIVLPSAVYAEMN